MAKKPVKQSAKTVASNIALENSKVALVNAAKLFGSVSENLSKSIEKQVTKLTELTTAIHETEILHAAQLEDFQVELENQKKNISEQVDSYIKEQMFRRDNETRSINETLRIARLEMDLALRENELNVLTTLSAKYGKVLLEEKEAEKLKKDQEVIYSDVSNEYNKQLASKIASLQREHEFVLQQELMKFEKESAKLEAENESLKSQLISARDETTRVMKQLDDLREAMVKMTQAQANSSVNVYNSDKK